MVQTHSTSSPGAEDGPSTGEGLVDILLGACLCSVGFGLLWQLWSLPLLTVGATPLVWQLAKERSKSQLSPDVHLVRGALTLLPCVLLAAVAFRTPTERLDHPQHTALIVLLLGCCASLAAALGRTRFWVYSGVLGATLLPLHRIGPTAMPHLSLCSGVIILTTGLLLASHDGSSEGPDL